jgi:hypothetical protein
MSVVLVGISHHQAPVELRERAALDTERAAELARTLAGENGEAVCLSTCNRTELYLADASAEVAERKGEAALLALEATLGPALARLRQRFGSADVYLEFWRKHPAFDETGSWNEDVEAYFRYDLEGAPPDLRPRPSEEAVRADGADLLVDEEVRSAFTRVRCPTQLVRAPRGLLNQPDPLLPEAVVAQALAAMPGLVDELVPDVNHYTVVLCRPGADAVARAISRAAAGDGR